MFDTCPQGHPLSGENLYLHGRVRRCKTCRREALQRFREREKEAKRWGETTGTTARRSSKR